MSSVLLSLLIGSAIAATPEQYARNWPQWRGPAANGLVLHGNPPLQWAEDKNIKWKLAIPGLGHATPIIWENKIFILTAVPASAGDKRLSFTLLCLDRQTGKTLWSKILREDVPHQEIQPTNSHSSGSPVTDGEHLIVSFGSFGLYCLDLDGALIWEKDLGKVQVTWGEGSSPALVGNTVIVIRDNEEASFVYAFDKRTGKELWKQPRDEKSSWTTPFVLTRDGKTEVIINGATAVRSYDPATGDVLWQCSGLGVNVTPMVVVDQNTLYAMSGQRTSPMAMAIELGRSGNLTDTAAVRWKLNRGTPYASSPLLYDGLLYFFQHVTPILTCVDAATGQPHYAQQRLEGLTTVYASPIGVNNRVYVTGLDGTTHVLEKSKELKILATNKLDDSFAASPAVVGNELFLRGRSHLYCIAER
jgi:outer membrane protein assembly factor BamB